MTDEELNARFHSLQVFVRSTVTAEGVATRRHFDVVGEGLRGDIQLLAEGHDALRQDVSDLKNGQQRLEAGVGRLEP